MKMKLSNKQRRKRKRRTRRKRCRQKARRKKEEVGKTKQDADRKQSGNLEGIIRM